ncbi:hypothetical protein VF10_02590, partial [Nostoc linckia z13]|uniref:hypothetical protein n=1 Tax=Nostoc linckia TaxID=92942 RepID=UPI000C029603
MRVLKQQLMLAVAGTAILGAAPALAQAQQPSIAELSAKLEKLERATTASRDRAAVENLFSRYMYL